MHSGRGSDRMSIFGMHSGSSILSLSIHMSASTEFSDYALPQLRAFKVLSHWTGN
jgi:hypothetical protein